MVKFGPETLGINNHTGEKFKSIIYPNPTTDKINIITNFEMVNVEIYNALGKLVLTSKTTTQINVSNFSKGIYLLKIETNQKNISKKIVIN